MRPTDPESTCAERDHGTFEARLLALRRHALIHALAQPYVCFHVPRVQQDLEVGRELDAKDIDVGRALPAGFACGPEAGETGSGEDAYTLSQRPDSIILGALDETGKVEIDDPVNGVRCWSGARERESVLTCTRRFSG